MPTNSITDSFYAWLFEIADREQFTEAEFFTAEKSWWGMYYEMACEL